MLSIKSNALLQKSLMHLSRTTRDLARSFERISSGLRISRAADDAAGLGVAENLKAAARSAAVAARNIQDGISIISVAEGATLEVGSILTRMRELAVQSASGTLASAERSYIQTEFVQLSAEVTRIASVTSFNGISLSNGSVTSLGVQVGIHATANDQIQLVLGDLRATVLGVDSGTINLSTILGARSAIAQIDSAITSVSTHRATLGAVENRLGSALNYIETFAGATAAAESQIRDADFGIETAILTQNQILQQAGISVLAQARNLSTGMLALLQ